MTNLSQATEEANARTSIYEEETKATNEIAEKFEEQVRLGGSSRTVILLSKKNVRYADKEHTEKDAIHGGAI